MVKVVLTLINNAIIYVIQIHADVLMILNVLMNYLSVQLIIFVKMEVLEKNAKMIVNVVNIVPILNVQNV